MKSLMIALTLASLMAPFAATAQASAYGWTLPAMQDDVLGRRSHHCDTLVQQLTSARCRGV